MKLNVRIVPLDRDWSAEIKAGLSISHLPPGMMCRLKDQSKLVVTMALPPSYCYCMFFPFPGWKYDPNDGRMLPDNANGVGGRTKVEEVLGMLEFSAEEG